MKDAEQDSRLATLASEMAWLRRLARALLRTDEAADLAHDAWLVAVDQAPTDRPLRPWLSRVALNLARMRGRSRRRRETREEQVASLPEPITTPDELVQRVEVQRLVADEVLRLAEPYRSTVLLHYFEELSCAEIARRLELPEGTVRRRLKVALDELRARLDTDRDENKGGGLAALIPLAGIPAAPTQTASVAVGVLAMKKILFAIVVLLALLAGFLWKTQGHARTPQSTASTPSSPIDLINRAAVRAAQPDLPAWLIQRDAKARHVAGRVMSSGVTVVGATVELASIASELGLISPPHSTTNGAGEFDFGPQPPTEVSVRASAPGKSATAIDLDLRNPRANTDHLVIELGGCNAMLMGTVRDASGGTIAKARITRRPLEGSPVPGGTSIVTDDNGHYEMCVEARWPGWVSVEVSAQGYGSIVFTSVVPGRVTADFALLPEATIVGRVVRDDTRAPVAQAYVFIPPGPRGLQTTAARGALTDNTGRFKLDRVAPGPHVVFARADGMAESRGTPVAAEAGQTTAELELRLETASTIRGVVVDHDHKPVSGARVATAAVERGHGSVAVSQDDGSFVLTEVPRGTTHFTALPYEVVTPQTFLANQPEHDGVVIEVASLGTIVGHVVHASKPVGDASITIQGPNDRDLEPIRSDAGGRFEARGLRSGPWTLYASNDHDGSFGGPETVHVGDAQTAEVTIDIKYSAAISGRVVDQNGAPVPGVTVAFKNITNDDVGNGVTSVDGTFRAPSLTGGGQYRPSVTLSLTSTTRLRPSSGDDFALVTVTDRDSEVTGVVLTVQVDHLSIAGKVVDNTGAPIPDVRVVAELTQPGSQPGFFRGRQDPASTTDMDGHFSISDLVDGTYAVQARSTSGEDTTVTDLKAGRSDVTIVLPVAGSIDGTIVGFKSAPAVTAIRSDGSSVVATIDGASFTVRNLSPGSYVVTGLTASEAATITVDVASGRTSHATLTSHGSGVVTGHVRDFRSNTPIEGMTCGAISRVGVTPGQGNPSDGVRTDPRGGFSLSSAPAGDIVVYCNGLWRLYSDGLRMITVQASQSSDVDVPIVAWTDTAHTNANFGAGFDFQVLVPRLIGVRPGGPAATGGFQDGDVVVSVDGVSVTSLSPTGVWILISNRPPGSKVKIGATRAGKSIGGEMTLGEAQ